MQPSQLMKDRENRKNEQEATARDLNYAEEIGFYA
jgi:hypothetical protein